MVKTGAEFPAEDLCVPAEEAEIHFELHPGLARENPPLPVLRTVVFNDYSRPDESGMLAIADALRAAHSAMNADYRRGRPGTPLKGGRRYYETTSKDVMRSFHWSTLEDSLDRPVGHDCASSAPISSPVSVSRSSSACASSLSCIAPVVRI